MLQRNLDPGAQGAQRQFLILLALSLLLRSLLAWRLPITGDEAYFYYWGRFPDWGFYDHPPMVGWWLALLSRWSSAPWVLRLPALLAPVLLAWMTVATMRRRDATLAWQAASLMLLAPLNAWNVAITTDIPLMVFGFAAVVAYLRALRTTRLADFALCGLMLAGALLSKYFAGMLALALAGHLLTSRRPHRLAELACVVAGSLPAALVQIPWNAANCWPNLMFNLVNRHETAGWSLTTPLLFAACLAYVLTPWVAWGLLRGGRETAAALLAPQKQRALAWLAGLPFLLFALMSAVKKVGLHWLASFVAPATLLFAIRASGLQRRRAIRWGMLFAAAHWLLIGGLSLVPLEKFSHLRGYPGLVMTLAPDSVTQALAPWRGRFVLAADGYSPAVTMGFNLNEYMLVFGPGSSHARHDDILTDFSKLDGRDILVISKDTDRGPQFAPYFDRIEQKVVQVRGVPFHLTEGYGFRYPAYRDQVLEQIRRDWYQVPTWLPAGPCYFCDRYFPDRSCHR